jgi:hypothetical protein
MQSTTEQDVIKAAWMEWLVSHQIASGNGASYIAQVVEIPGWFRSFELGMAIPEGPSIFWTFDHLDQINRAHRHLLACPDRPKPPKPKEQDIANQRRREWRAILRFRRAELSAMAAA